MSKTTAMPDSAIKPVPGSLLFAPGHSARLVDAILMGCVVVRINIPAIGFDVPFAQLALIVMIIIAAFRRPVRSFARAWWFPVLAVALLTYLTVVSMINDVDYIRRLGNIAVLMTVAGFLASGRIDVASAVKGIGAALVINVGLFYTGLAPDEYGGVLTGLLADKNAAGLVYGVGALLCSLATRRIWLRIVILVAGAGALVLTDSRTSMAAYGAAIVWLSLANWRGFIYRMLLAAGLISAFIWANENLAEIGQYEITRAGSDALRDRIDEAAVAKVAETPWYGGGLGEAVVFVEDRSWFFHNAYDALLVEGGMVAMIVVVGIYILTGFGRFYRKNYPFAEAILGGATLFVLFTATRLGEVFFAPIGFVLLGVGLAFILENDPFNGIAGFPAMANSEAKPEVIPGRQDPPR